MELKRRQILRAGLLGSFAATAAVARAGAVHAAPTIAPDSTTNTHAEPLLAPLVSGTDYDQKAILQAAIDAATETRRTLTLPPGTFVVSEINLPNGARINGALGQTTLVVPAGAPGWRADGGSGLMLRDFHLRGDTTATAKDRSQAPILLTIRNAKDVELSYLTLSAGHTGIVLDGVSGRITDCNISRMSDTGLKAVDSAGLSISANTVSDCADNGILVWRSAAGVDGTIVTTNRISNIRNVSGGSGQYGNGVNVFRADGVIVSHNVISACTYSAVRGNAASNLHIVANTCHNIGEVALYAEFAFTGAVIASNIVDGAATGIAVTNFNEGGRLAVVQGNLVRNLIRREFEPVDKRGIGISVEADTSVTGNTIENAPDAGIQIGWGPYMRSVGVTGNVIRSARIGVAVTADAPGRTCLIANNVVNETAEGAIRTMRYGTPFGEDLAAADQSMNGIRVAANVAG